MEQKSRIGLFLGDSSYAEESQQLFVIKKTLLLLVCGFQCFHYQLYKITATLSFKAIFLYFSDNNNEGNNNNNNKNF